MNKTIYHALESIMHGPMRPWLVPSYSDEKFFQMTKRLPKIEPPFQLKCTFNYPESFNGKTRYYRELIDHGKVVVLHEINKVLTDKEMTGFKLNRKYDEIKEGLHYSIETASRILSSVRLGSAMLVTEDLSTLADSVIPTNCFIIDYLRLSLIQISAELKSHFSDVVSDIMFSTGFLQVPDLGFNDRPMAILGPVVPEPPTGRFEALQESEQGYRIVQTPFVAIMDDIRSPKTGIVPYKFMVRHPVSFGWVEEHLNKDRFIDGKYSFCGRHGCKNKLTAIYHTLIEKNYFNHIDDSTGEKIMTIDIVRFLDYRYGIDLEIQFHAMKKDAGKRARLIHSVDWLKDLPACKN